jgi:WD40 repeat protein
MTRQNPWPALLPFGEDDQEYFGGREDEISALFRRIASTRLTLLFGLSGLGKTSLLQAGLFPKLRREHYFPVYIRLAYGRELPTPIEQVKAAIVEAMKSGKIEAPDPPADRTLWEYFHDPDVDFWADNYPATPVLVFDQFEELFTKSREVQKEAEALVDELTHLAEGASSELLRTAGAHDRELLRQAWEDNYRLVFAMRSDYLAQLQGISGRVRSVFANRYELRRMSGEAALRSTLKAGQAIVTEEEGRKIVRVVAGTNDEVFDDERPELLSVKGLQVEPALLSLFCAELNELRGDGPITAGLLNRSKDDILSNFYENSRKDVTPELQELIEDKLVTRDGKSRNFVSEQTVLETPGVVSTDVDKLVDRRLLRYEESGATRRLELTHDLLAPIVAASRAEREHARKLAEAEQAEAEAKREKAIALRAQRRTQAAALLFCTLIVIVAVLVWMNRRTILRTRTVEGDSAFRLAFPLLESDDPRQGLAYLARVLERDPTNEAARKFTYAQLLARRWPVPVRTLPVDRIEAADISPDGSRAVIRVRRRIETWDLLTAKMINRVDAGYDNAEVSFLSDGWTVKVKPSPQSLGRNQQVRFWNGRPGGREIVAPPGRLLADVAFDADALAFIDGDRIVIGSIATPGQRETVAFTLPQGVRPAAAQPRISFAPGGRYLLIQQNTSLEVWDRVSRRMSFQYGNLEEGWQLAGFSGAGHDVQVGIAARQNFSVWRLATGDHVRSLDVVGSGRSVYLGNGGTITAANPEGGFYVWSSGSDHPLQIKPGPAFSIVLSPDGRRLMTVGLRSVRCWSTVTGEEVALPISHATDVSVAGFAAGGRAVVTIADRAMVWEYAAVVPQPRAVGAIVMLSSDTARALALDKSEEVPAALSGLDSTTGAILWTYRASEDEMAIGIDLALRTLVLTKDSTPRSSRLLDAQTDETIATLPTSHAVDATFSDDGRYVAVEVSRDSAASSYLLLTAKGKEAGPPIDLGQDVAAVEFSGDGRWVAVTGYDGTVVVREVASRRTAGPSIRHDAFEWVSVDFSGDGRLLATTGRKTGAAIWDVRGGLRRLAADDSLHVEYEMSQFSPDGTKLALATTSDVQLWDVAALRRGFHPEGKLGAVSHAGVDVIEFSADGAVMLTAGSGYAQVWDVTTLWPLSARTAIDEESVPKLAPEGNAFFVVSDRVLNRIDIPEISRRDGELLARLANGIAMYRVANLGVTEPIDGRREIDAVVAECKGNDGAVCKLVRWLETPSDRRTISPGFKMSVDAYVKQRLEADETQREKLHDLFPGRPLPPAKP